MNWDHVFDGIDPRFRLSSAVQPFAVSGLAGSSIRPTGTLSYNTIAAHGNLNVIIEALRDQGETKIVVNPHVTIKDGSEATIKVVTDQPYAQAQLESGTTNVVGEDIKFIEVGATLSVTPRINDQKMISMDIKPEVSSVVGEYQAFRPVPIVRKSLAETSVMIEDGQTVIIAGMIDTQKDVQQERIPILGAIPLLGFLFRSETETSQSTEMIAFITPRVITGKEPVQRLRDMKKRPRPMRTVGLGESKKLKPIR